MPAQPNILLFLPDGMQAATIDPGHDCQTPHFDRLAERGLRFTRAHTVCPTCSPARSSLMTGLLPHNHGVLEVEHGRDPDQCVLRTDRPHWAQRLSDAGYRTGYFGKWHIERSHRLEQFGWQEYVCKGSEHVRNLGKGSEGPAAVPVDERLSGYLDGPEGYNRILHYGVTDVSAEERSPGITTRQAQEFLRSAMMDDRPWCCCVSFSEPNEALVVGRDVYEQYDVDSIELPPNLRDDFRDRPNLYQRQQAIAAKLSERHWREARACYYGRITELDRQFGKLLDQLDAAGALDKTIVILVADHGRYVGAHGFDAHNCGPFEEIYRIPLLASGPGILMGQTSTALVGIHDLCPTLLELGGVEPIDAADSRSFAPVLRDPVGASAEFDEGYAEYHGTRFPLMQRILWQGPWKMVFNGFDFDELYNLKDDPHEMRNLARLPEHQPRIEEMMRAIWKRVRGTGDRAIAESHYFSMRLAVVGPNA